MLIQGSVVWVRLLDPDGRNPKCRPAVVVTPSREIVSTGSVFVVAASTSFSTPLPNNKVELPWSSTGHSRTRLTKPCVVVCDWVVEIAVENIERVGGVVPPAILAEILRRLPPREGDH